MEWIFVVEVGVFQKVIVALLEGRAGADKSGSTPKWRILLLACNPSSQILALDPDTNEKHFEARYLSDLMVLYDSIHALHRVEADKRVS